MTLHETEHFAPDAYTAVRDDFVLKIDGSKPVLYPLDFLESSFFVISPTQAFALSLLSGTRQFRDAEAIFQTVLPSAPVGAFGQALASVDDMVRDNPTQSGIGVGGIIQSAATPFKTAAGYKPTEFVVAPDDFYAEMNDIRWRRRLHTPINIMLVPTHRCRTNCIYCYAERRKVKELTLKRWQELINEMSDNEIHLVSLDNGDIFARKDGVSIIEHLLDNEMHFLLSTKSLVTVDSVSRIVDAGFTRKVRNVLSRKIQLSIDACDPPLAFHITRNRNFIEHITRTFDNFYRAGIRPKIKSVMMQCNREQPEKLVEYFYKRGAREFQFVKYTRSFYNHADDMFLDNESIDIIQTQLKNIRDRYPDIQLSDGMNVIDPTSADLSVEQREAIWQRRAGCGGGWSMLGISADGSAFLCEQMTLDPDYCVGDLKEQTICEVWRSERMRNFIYPTRDMFKDTICHSCDAFEPCHWEKGYCYRNAFFSYGTIYDAPPLCPMQTKRGVRLS